MRCDGLSPHTGRRCPNDATHKAGDTAVYACNWCAALPTGIAWHPLPADPPLLRAARLAAAALTMALATERDAADEAERGTNERWARLRLDTDRQSAAVAIGSLCAALPPHRVPEVAAMADGAARGYARASWALRLVAIASEVGRG